MEFIVSRNKLLAALNHAKYAINPKQFFGCLKCFVFTFPQDQEINKMTVHASNGEVWISETVPVKFNHLSADAPEPVRNFSVFYHDIYRTIKSLEEQPLTFRVHEYQLSVHHSYGSFRLKLENMAEEFLSIPKPCPDIEAEDGYQIKHEAPGLRSILNKCNFAMAKYELRPVMSGVYMNLTKDFSDYVSSDGHKLVRVRKDTVCSTDKDEFSLIIPPLIVKTLLKILPQTGEVDFEYQKPLVEEKTVTIGDQSQKCIETKRKGAARITIDDNLVITFIPIDGKYPHYWSVIPEQFDLEIKVQRRQLIKSIDRLSLFTADSNMLVTDISENEIILSSKNIDYEMDGNEHHSCELLKSGISNLPLRLGFNASSLSATLKALSADEVILYIIDNSRPLVIKPKPQPDVEEVTMLLMPMYVSD